ncbi:putative lipid II flippase FtsW [Permianibacter sp. IMCC34836]|nr:putative lipid II flippase FtsW [Permianibacter fluminis]
MNATLTARLKSLFQHDAGKSPVLFDRWLAGLTVLLLALGILMVASSSLPFAMERNGNGFYFVLRHLVYLSIGGAFAAVVLTRPSTDWQKIAMHLLVACLVMLVLVLILGREINGAKRWLGAGVFTVQVSELAKLFVIIYLADYLQRRNELLRTRFEGFFRPLLILGFTAFLLLLEPDYGASVVIMATCLAMMFLAGAKVWQFAALCLVAGSVLAVVALSAEYRLARLKTFLDPWADPYGSGYQLTQSLIAFGRGEWWGQGLGNSLQKLAYLPEAHTDFVFAVFAEEFGLVGVAVVLTLFALLVLRILRVAQLALKAEMAFSAYACVGIATWFALQALINIGVASGALPTKGLTLPFISYGGNALIVTVVAIAFVLRVDFERRLRAGVGRNVRPERLRQSVGADNVSNNATAEEVPS